MVAPTKTPYGHQLDELAERLNPSSKVMRTSQAADIYEPIKVLGEPRPAVSSAGQVHSSSLRPPRPRVASGANPPSAVGNIRTTSGQGIIGDIGPSRKVRPTRAVGGLEGRGVRPDPGSRRRPIRWWT